MHRRTAFKEQVSWLFVKKTRVLRRSGVMDRSPSVAFVERHRGRHRLYLNLYKEVQLNTIYANFVSFKVIVL